MRFLIIPIILILTSSPASAQTVCAGHDTVVNKLKSVFGEKPTSRGLSSNGGMIEVYASDGGTWTIVLTRPDGLSCLIATGNFWETMKSEPKGLKM